MSLIKKLRMKTRSARRAVFTRYSEGLRKGDAPLKILDIGGTVAFWEDWWKLSAADKLEVTLINTHALDDTCRGRVASSPFITDVNQDALTLTVEQLRAHDLIFSNSFFEHLASRQAQEQLAGVITASGVPYFIQVPNKHSPVDPHHPFAPFFALYPKCLRIWLLLFSSFGNGPASPNKQAAKAWQDNYHPLGCADMRALFPQSVRRIERPFGVPMSILAFKP